MPSSMSFSSFSCDLLTFNFNISDNIKVSVYVPTSDVFKLSKGHYLLVYALLEMYKQGLTKDEINDLSFQKILILEYSFI